MVLGKKNLAPYWGWSPGLSSRSLVATPNMLSRLPLLLQMPGVNEGKKTLVNE